jgi:uncharacterized membrane protein HdeD (DUF308 family)
VLSGLAVNWVFLLLRAVVAAMFGIAALVWPVPSSWVLVMLFGAYAAADGILALLIALSVRGVPGFGALLFEAIVRLGVAAFAFASPARAALALTNVFAAWAVLSGIAALAVAVSLRRDLTGEWPLPLTGAVSVLFGLLLVAGAGAPELQWVVGPYALLFGFTLLALALRLRQLAYEIAVAS